MMKTNSAALILPDQAPVAATNDIRGLKAPVAIPSAWTWIWWALAALLLVALGWWLWRRWRQKKTVVPPAILIPPHERALERLREALELMGQPRPFCIAVSGAVRVYLEERFELRAPERTTEEFLDELQSSALMTFDQKQTLGAFLMQCDLVKFARYQPGEPELRQLYDAAVRLVEETQPPPPVAESGAETAASSASTL